jgi:hypothetical protein
MRFSSLDFLLRGLVSVGFVFGNRESPLPIVRGSGSSRQSYPHDGSEVPAVAEANSCLFREFCRGAAVHASQRGKAEVLKPFDEFKALYVQIGVDSFTSLSPFDGIEETNLLIV